MSAPVVREEFTGPGVLLSGAPVTSRGSGARALRAASIASLVIALALWPLAVLQARGKEVDDFGLVSILPWPFWAGLASLGFGFALCLIAKPMPRALPTLQIVALVLFLHGTPTVVYDLLRYSWAWKHLAIVDYIQRHHAVDPVAPFLSAYHNWPGLFLVTAWIGDALGLNSLDLSKIVKFTPPVLSTLYVFALGPIFRRFSQDSRLVHCALWLFVVGNWVGQEYFSPQGFAYLAYLLIVGLCIGPLSAVVGDAARLGPLARGQARLAEFFARGVSPSRELARPWTRMGAAVAVLLLISATVATHQLTPIAIVFALGALCLVARLNVGFFIYAAIAEAFWVLYCATPFVVTVLRQQVTTFGQGINAASENLVTFDNASLGQVWVIVLGRGLTVAIAALSAAGAWRRLSLGYRDGVPLALAASSCFLLLSRYDGEILFRFYLFALPFLAFFAAAAFFPGPEKARGRVAPLAFALTGTLFAVAFLFANDGKDRWYTFPKDEVDASNWLYANAPANSLIVEGSRDYPCLFLNYENFVFVPISSERPDERKRIADDPVSVLADWLSDPKWSASYVMLTTSQKIYSNEEHVLPRGTLAAIENALLASPRFVLVKATPNAKIFALSSFERPMDAAEKVERAQ